MSPLVIIGAALIIALGHLAASWLEARDRHQSMGRLLGVHNAVAHNPPGARKEPHIPLDESHSVSN